jgi:hypothetical protein
MLSRRPADVADVALMISSSRSTADANAYAACVADDLHLFHVTCGGCTASWAGQDRAHCGRCHVTYDSIMLYDAHRAGGRCVRPQVLGLVSTKNGIWGQPAPGHRRTG